MGGEEGGLTHLPRPRLHPRPEGPVPERAVSSPRGPAGVAVGRAPRTMPPPDAGLSRSRDGSQGTGQGAHSPASPVEHSARSPARPPFRESRLGGARSKRLQEWPGAPRARRAARVPEAGAAGFPSVPVTQRNSWVPKTKEKKEGKGKGRKRKLRSGGDFL